VRGVGRRLRENGLHGGGAAEGQVPQLVVVDARGGQQQLFLLGGRKALLEADEVLGLGELRRGVGRADEVLALGRLDRQVVDRSHLGARPQEFVHLQLLEGAFVKEPLQAFAILGRVDLARDLEGQARPFAHRLGQDLESLPRRRVEARQPRRELDPRKVVVPPERRRDQRERRRGRLGDQVHQHLDDDPPYLELGVVQRTGDRHVEIDDAMTILQQRHGQANGRLDRVGTLDLVAERELVDDDLVAGVEPPGRDLVAQREIELALPDGVAHVFAGVGADGRQLEVLQVDPHVDEQVLRQRVDLAEDGQRARVVDGPAKIDSGRGAQRRRQAGDRSGEIRQRRRIAGAE